MSEPPEERRVFPFRPWVRRAGLSIVVVALGVTVAMAAARFGERAFWVYIATLWIGGLKVWLGTLRPVAEADARGLVLRPLHNLRQRAVAWERITGTEQMIGGDRLIVYYETQRGIRFVALNLNLVKGRREFLMMLETRLRRMGFVEKTVERSRYLTRSVETLPPQRNEAEDEEGQP